MLVNLQTDISIIHTIDKFLTENITDEIQLKKSKWFIDKITSWI